MKYWLTLMITTAFYSPVLQAQSATGAKEQAHIKELITDHRAMAQAHENAAKCLESGKGEKACHAELQKACKGLGIGKTCGMRHHSH